MSASEVRNLRRFIAAIGVVATGCATTLAGNVAWPAAPAQERIRLVRTFSGAADLEGSVSQIGRAHV